MGIIMNSIILKKIGETGRWYFDLSRTYTKNIYVEKRLDYVLL